MFMQHSRISIVICWLFSVTSVRARLSVLLCMSFVQQTTTAFVTSYVDYCNSVLSSMSKKVTDKLQYVQNAAACLVTGTWKYEHGLFWLMHDDLHWLVIPQRVHSVQPCCDSPSVFGTVL